MPSSGKQSTDFSSQTETGPWKPAVPQISNLLNFTAPQFQMLGLQGDEQKQLDYLRANADNGNPFAPAINQTASQLLSGGTDRTGIIQNAYSGLQNNLNPIATQSTNPYDNQAFQQLANTITNDTKDQVKSAYAGSGYSPASVGDFSQQLGRGIAQGVAPAFVQAQDTLTNQRMGAANSLYQGGAGTTGILSGLDQTALGNKIQGIPVASAALQANDSPYLRMLQLTQMQRQMPLDNIAGMESLLLPIGGMGGTSNTSGQSTTNSSSFNPMGILSGVSGLFGGGSGLAGGLLSGMFSGSDRRIKEDIHEIGALKDGTPVYSFRYKGRPETHIGLMAQDVEKFEPDAVREFNGIKFVDYHKATERARRAA